MLAALRKLLPHQFQPNHIPVKEPGEAYDIWSASYDAQSGNLMLDLDQTVFNRLLQYLNLHHKKVADIGCGTGRHWPQIIQQNPACLVGYDVSAGMLEKLKAKFPRAETHLITNNLFQTTPTSTFDVVISTLTIAHIKNLEEALLSWCRILKHGGDIIITDFHPQALQTGGKRTFKHENRHIEVRNFVHHTDRVKTILGLKNIATVHEEQIVVNEAVKHYYERQNALHVYKRFEGMPIIYGLHLKHQP